VKVNNDVLGYDARVTAGNCSLASSPEVKLVSLLDLAAQAGNHPVDSTKSLKHSSKTISQIFVTFSQGCG
jgi:hypothetical protein